MVLFFVRVSSTPSRFSGLNVLLDGDMPTNMDCFVTVLFVISRFLALPKFL